MLVIYDQVHGLLNTADLGDKVPIPQPGSQNPLHCSSVPQANPHGKDTERREGGVLSAVPFPFRRRQALLGSEQSTSKAGESQTGLRLQNTRLGRVHFLLTHSLKETKPDTASTEPIKL